MEISSNFSLIEIVYKMQMQSTNICNSHLRSHAPPFAKISRFLPFYTEIFSSHVIYPPYQASCCILTINIPVDSQSLSRSATIVWFVTLCIYHNRLLVVLFILVNFICQFVCHHIKSQLVRHEIRLPN